MLTFSLTLKIIFRPPRQCPMNWKTKWETRVGVKQYSFSVKGMERMALVCPLLPTAVFPISLSLTVYSLRESPTETESQVCVCFPLLWFEKKKNLLKICFVVDSRSLSLHCLKLTLKFWRPNFEFIIVAHSVSFYSTTLNICGYLLLCRLS